MSRILRLNMADQSCRWQEVAPHYAGLGGRALTSRLLRTEVDPTCHPLSAVNKLVVAPGLLSGTTAANSGRISLGGKSPLTGGLKQSHAGGTFSPKLARLDIKAVVVEGKPQQNDGFYLVKISQDGVEFFPASEYEGLGNYRTMAQLWKRFGRSVGVMSIGQAGEKRLTAACLHFTDPRGRPGRPAGRGGLGALMGSKKLKALVVDDRGAPSGVHLADPEKFKAAARKWARFIAEPPVSGQARPALGSAGLINLVNEAGALGANTRIKNLGEIAIIDRLCHDFGLDALEMGVTLGLLMAGGVIPWGDGPAAIKMMKKVAKNDPWGLIIGNGSGFTGRALGLERVPAVQGLGLPASGSQAEKDVGFTYATGPIDGEGDPLKSAGNLEMSRNLQIATAVLDSTGLCLSVAPPGLDNPEALQCVVDLVNARHGLNLTIGDVGQLGRQALHDELSFNRDAGFTQAHDRLPAFFQASLNPPDVTWDFTDQEIDAVLRDL